MMNKHTDSGDRVLTAVHRSSRKHPLMSRRKELHSMNFAVVVRAADRLRFALFLLAASAVAGCGGEEETSDGEQAKAPQRPPALVRVGKMREADVPYRIESVGSITPSRTTIVASGADGIVDEFPVEEGQYVRTGDVLSVLRMKSSDLSIAEAEAVELERRKFWEMLETGSREEEKLRALAEKQQAAVMRSTASRRLTIAQRLYREGTMNQSDLDDAIEAEKAAAEALKAAEAAYELVKLGPRDEEIEQARLRFEAQRNQVEFLKNEREKRTTRAPFDGYIVSEMTHLGQWLSKGDPVITLIDLSSVEVTVDIDQRDIRYIQMDQTVDIRIDGTSGPETNGLWRGRIIAVVPRSDWREGSRGFPVRVRIENQFSDENEERAPVLKEGMIAQVVFEGPPERRLMAPKDALVRSTRGISLFTVKRGEDPNSGTAQQVPVELGISSGEMVEVFPRPIGDVEIALLPDQEVVIEGAERLRPLSPVRITVEAAAGRD